MARSRRRGTAWVAVAGLAPTVLLGVVLTTSPGLAQQAGGVAERARAVLVQRCGSAGCHGESAFTSFSVFRRETLLAGEIVKPRDPAGSRLLRRVEEDGPTRMPLGGEKVPPQELDALRAWIQAGAPELDSASAAGDSAPVATPATPLAPARPAPRAPVSEAAVLQAILRDLEAAPEQDQRQLRYYSLANVANNPAVGAAELDLYRHALSSLLNHLSREHDVVPPQALGPQRLVLRVRLADYGWNAETWNRILAGYPYGVLPRGFTAQVRQIHTLSGARLPYVRVDWFVAEASVPPLYHDVLALPQTVRELEQQLGVRAAENLASGRAARFGVRNSGVSVNNRAMERHPSTFGAYWKSYDFAGNRAEQSIFRNPLQFREDGGEFIFHLPNGLQGYYIADARGRRLDTAPVDIVFDRSNPRNPTVTNGRSCMGCHFMGMRPFRDEIAPNLQLLEHTRAAFDQERAEQLYPGQAELERLLRRDNERFLAALRATGAPVPDSPGREPISRLAERYAADLSTAQAAADVYLEATRLQRLVEGSSELKRLGFSQLLGPNGGIKRDTWEEHFGTLVSELRLGEFLRPALPHPTPPHAPTPQGDRRPSVGVAAVSAPTPAQAARLRSLLVYWLGQSPRLRVASTGADHTLRVTVRPEPGGQLGAQVTDAAGKLQASVTAPSDDLSGLAEQLAAAVHFHLTGEAAPAAPTPLGAVGGAPPPGVANDFERLLSTTAPGGADVQLALGLDRGPESTYRAGERVEILLRVDRDAFVTLYNQDAAGKVTILFPNADQPLNRVRANQLLSFPAEVDPNGTFGLERVIAVATLEDVPLPGVGEFRADPATKSLRPLAEPPRVVAAGTERIVRGGSAGRPATAVVRFFTAR